MKARDGSSGFVIHPVFPFFYPSSGRWPCPSGWFENSCADCPIWITSFEAQPSIELVRTHVGRMKSVATASRSTRRAAQPLAAFKPLPASFFSIAICI